MDRDQGHGKKEKVAVGLSGGVDSSVTAALLQGQGYDLVGISMEIFDRSLPLKESPKHACYGPGEEEDIEAAAAVCKRLDIPFHVIDLKKEYSDHVINYFRREYLTGRTPNPCVRCNRRLKFDLLLEKAKKIGLDFDLFATGHYARVEKRSGRFVLRKAVDPKKDQSYFLYALTQQQLSHILFPLGNHTKERVREIARSLGLETANRPESQDFMGSGHYPLLFGKEGAREGDIVDRDGNVLGRHRGIIHYTVGQRRGLGIAADSRLYVVEIDAEANRIVVGHRDHLISEGLVVNELNLILHGKLDRPYRVKAKIRLRHKEADATLFPHKDNKALLLFDKPQVSVTPGQSAVMYCGDLILGGGIIEKPIGGGQTPVSENFLLTK